LRSFSKFKDYPLFTRLRAFNGDSEHEADCHSANEPEREIRDAVCPVERAVKSTQQARGRNGDGAERRENDGRDRWPTG
jgi:hypothetical protein